MPEPRAALPGGVLTFCLTDLEDSALQWDRDPSAMSAAVARHQAIVHEAVRDNDGTLLLEQGEGDSTVSVFVSPISAARAAAAIQRQMAGESWPGSLDLRMRIALNTGEAEQRDGTYYGRALNRAGRIRALAAGGQTLLSKSTAELVEDAVIEGTTVRLLGSVELRGLSRAEEIHSLEVEGALVQPDLVGGRRSNVPVLLTTFVGRGSDRARLRAALDAARVVTITGPGGSGKTRLSIEVARDVADEGSSRVWFVDLAPIEDGNLVHDAIASTIGALDDDGADKTERIIAALGAAPTLLLLDNCEHLVRECGAVVRELAAGCPNLRVLATSQMPLGLPGEAVFPLPPLAVPSKDDAGLTVGRSEAVQLLVERATRHDPGFRLSEDNAAAVGEICRCLDGLPLALELAAAHLRILTPQQILDRLGDDRFRLLAEQGASTDARHGALAPTLDWSYGLLDERARILLRRLSVFRGGFTLPAAEAVGAGPGLPSDEVYPILADLVARSMVAHRTRGGEMRYWLFESIRDYAGKKLQAAVPAQPAAWTIYREGQYWTLEADRTVRLRATKGLGYVATLVEHPGREMHVLDLVEPAGTRAGTSDGDEILDAQARAAYRDHISGLRGELDEALSRSDVARAEHLEAEIDAVVAQLASATGLGGRARRTAGAAQRARMSVTKAVRSAVDKIQDELPLVGAHLDRSIRTGVNCCYRPEDGQRLHHVRP